jgi:predicted  nucleic acid-binding Zn-ribbon protein
MTYYSDKDYGILHDHMSAIARERDHANRVIATLEKQIEELQDEISLAQEALRRAFPENQA